jgi:hypothetical protein
VKAALANNATSKPAKGGVEVSFNAADKHLWVGFINAKDQFEKVSTWIDNPILGDTLVETKFSGYRVAGGHQFSAHIVRTQGGTPCARHRRGRREVQRRHAGTFLNGTCRGGLCVSPARSKAPPRSRGRCWLKICTGDQ